MLSRLRSVLMGLLVAAGTARGVTFTVNSPSDAPDAAANGVCETANGNHVCTLRAAISEANATTNAIIYVPGGTTIFLSGLGAYAITASMTILKSGGSGPVVIDANGQTDRLFTVGAATAALSGLTIQNGHALSNGGCISTSGTLVLASVVLSGCTAQGSYGGAIFSTGTTTVTGSVITGANSGAGGGGICQAGATLSITGSTISGNHANVGGGLYANSATVTLDRSTMSGNTSTVGGGIATDNGGVVKLVNSTLSGNSSTQDGGGIYSGEAFMGGTGNVEVYSSTITENRSDSDANGTGYGGGVAVVPGASLSFTDTIVANNHETLFLSGFYIDVYGDCEGTLTSDGYNVMRSVPGSRCTITGPAPLVGDPKLDLVLKDNGGTVETHALLAGSPAIDAGNPAGCLDALGATLTSDTRGVTRPIGAHCDAGAYELEPKGDASGDGAVNVGDVFYVINFLFAGGPVPKGRANVNGDGSINVSDVFYLINFLFAGGPAPV